MRPVISSIESEYRRYERMGERVLEQLDAKQLVSQPTPESNSVATIVWHISGNLESRFTDFLHSDGEKPWREREDEFAVRTATPHEVVAKWEQGWAALFVALEELTDADLERTVTIRAVPFTVTEALHRSLAHTSYHLGQMVYVGKMLTGEGWTYLSIPPGGTDAYNRNPTLEKGPAGSA